MAGKKNNDNEITVRDASKKLDISDATARKYLKDFAIGKAKGFGGKAVITAEMFSVLSEIVKLRANGLSIQEIKDLMSKEPSKDVAQEETTESSTEENTETTANTTFDASDLLDELKQKVDSTDAVGVDEGPSEPSANGKDDDAKSDMEDATEMVDEELSGEDSGEDAGSTTEKKRLFNYRYVERQISNDSKKISWLRQRLRNPNVSLQDKLFYEESLDRRILFLDGWKHILRYISCK